jgi:SOS response associated peptidase (SRAP)/NACHT domain
LTKLKEDCRRLRGTHPDLEEILFATTRPVTEDSKRKWREEIRSKFGIQLRDVVQREWITTELEKPSNRWLCKDYLDIPLKEFEKLPETLPRIRSAAAKLLDAWKEKHQFGSHPLIDLPLQEFRTGGTAVRLSDLPTRLSAGDRCWITGVPGAGKTFSLITIASALTSPDSLIPIVISLRDLSHRGYKLLDWIVSEPSFREQGISEPELANAASAGKLLILLNGWNEIARNVWVPTTEAITSFVRQMPGSAVLVTSRQPPERDFKLPAREIRVKPLSGEDIRNVIRQVGLDDADRHADFILASDSLSEIAVVPLFLQAIIQEAKAGNQLPLGKQAMLRRMIERAEEEHRSALEHGEVRHQAFRYLRSLAWEMTKAASTTLPDNKARLAISNTVRELKEEALLGEAPAPPEILEQLRAAHLLVSVSGGEVAFTHQLIQEYFAATWITSVLREAVSNGDLVFHREYLTDYQWEQPLFLTLEDLAEENRSAEIRVLLNWFRLVDFEAACRMAGLVSDFWPAVRDLFEPVIRHLASLENVNARWLAARCAAAIGEAEFQDLVWAAFEGHPKDSSDCFEGISSTFLLRALGEGFADKLLQVPEEEFRLRALALAGRSPSVESLRLAENLAINDPAVTVRRLAFLQLFVSGRRGWLRRFLEDAKSQGWSLGMLRVLHASPQCGPAAFRKFIRLYFDQQTTTEERIKTLNLWSEMDAAGASVMARAEYDGLTERCLVPADGFYEWKKVVGGRIPYSIAMKNDSSFVFAGLWEGWQNPETKEWLRTCTIITGEPNELVA